MTNPQILAPRESLTDENGKVTRTWWRYFADLQSANSNMAADLAATKAALAALTKQVQALPAAPTVTGGHGVVVS